MFLLNAKHDLSNKVVEKKSNLTNLTHIFDRCNQPLVGDRGGVELFVAYQPCNYLFIKSIIMIINYDNCVNKCKITF